MKKETTLLKQQIEKTIEETKSLFNKYGMQIKKCNSKNSTQADFDVLSKVKSDWQISTDKITSLETELNRKNRSKA